MERFHKTYRADFLIDHDRRHSTMEEAQAALDTWVEHYNTKRPHQSLGDRPPIERFRLAQLREAIDTSPIEQDELVGSPTQRPPGVSRWVDQQGSISLNGLHYRVGPTFAGEPVEVVVQHGLVDILHAGVLIATHAERRRKGSEPSRSKPPTAPRSRPPSSGMTVVRSVDSGGSISFAGASYRVGRSWGRHSVEVAIVAGSVQISANSKVIRVHQIRHDRAKEHGAFASPKGRPRHRNIA